MLVIWTIIGALALYALMKYLQGKRYKLPPGPKGLPFIGNAMQIDMTKPHQTITDWSDEYGDVYTIKNFGKTTVVLNSFDTIYEGLVTQGTKYAGRVESYRMQVLQFHSPDILTTTFSKEWAFRKKLVLQNLKMYGNSLENLEVISLDLIGDMLEEMKTMARTGPTDIYTIYHRCVTGIVTSIIYGEKVPNEVVAGILKCLDDCISLLAPSGGMVLLDMVPLSRYIPNPWHNTLIRVAHEFRDLVLPRINKRRVDGDPGNAVCFVDAMLDYQRKAQDKPNEMPFSDKELYGVTTNLLTAGTFTTSTKLNALIAVMVNMPEVQDRMFKEIKSEIGERQPRLSDRKKLHYVEASILEILRYSSIVTLNMPHCMMEDAQLNGYDLPKGTEVLFNLWKLHHDPRYWDKPWEFKPERYMDENGQVVPADHINRKRLLAFGASRRVCLGETLGRNRLFLMVTSMVQHFKFLPAGPNERPKHDPREYKASLLAEPHRYRVNIEYRQ